VVHLSRHDSQATRLIATPPPPTRLVARDMLVGRAYRLPYCVEEVATPAICHSPRGAEANQFGQKQRRICKM